MIDLIRSRIIEWLAPSLLGRINSEIDRQRWMLEAIHDLHIVPIPYNEATIQIAFENARNFEPDLFDAKSTIQDRQASLIEIYRRSQ